MKTKIYVKETNIPKKTMKKVEIDIINDGYIFFNFSEKDVKQMKSVYYVKQDTWYIYQDKKDVKSLTGLEMLFLKNIIYDGISTSKFLEILLNVGKKGYYRPKIDKKILNKYYPDGLLLGELFEDNVSISIYK